MITQQPLSQPPRPRTAARPPVPILILDDERVDRYRLARLCSGLPFPCQVSNAKTLEEFRGLLARDRFGLVLVDYALPDGSGLDALEMLRLSEGNLNAPSVMITGMQTAELSDRAHAAGCTGFLSKDDLTPARFASAIGKVLGTSLLQPRARASYSTQEVEQLLSLCATRAARSVKPRVSRLMRQLREVRTDTPAQTTAGLRALEQSCMSLWHFLVERERDEGPHHLAELIADPGDFAPDDPLPRGGKPPSPFSPRRH